MRCDKLINFSNLPIIPTVSKEEEKEMRPEKQKTKYDKN